MAAEKETKTSKVWVTLCKFETIEKHLNSENYSNKPLTVICAVNDKDERCALTAFVAVNKKADEGGEELWKAIADISYDAEDFEGLITVPGEEWLRTQMSKVVTILTDSANSAKASAKELKRLIEAFTGIEDHNIVLHDCSMHLTSNFEKQVLKQLDGSPSREALRMVSSLFGTRNPHRDHWRARHEELKGAFQREVGVRSWIKKELSISKNIFI